MVLEEVDETRPNAESSSSDGYTFIISARDEADWKANVRRYLHFFMTSYLDRLELGSVCRSTQVSRDHFVVRSAWLVNTWSELTERLQTAIPPTLPAPSKEPRIGIWFADYGYFQLGESTPSSNARSLLTASEAVKEQLSKTDFLSQLGYKVSVVGGEGYGELAAAVYSGVMPVSAILDAAESPKSDEEIEVALVKSSEESLWSELVLWRDEELSVIGRKEVDLFVVKGLSTVIDMLEFSSTSIQIVQRHLSNPGLNLTIDLNVSFSKPRVPIVSSYTTGIIDEGHWSKPSYWKNIMRQNFRSDLALDAMSAQCDVIVYLGPYQGSYSRAYLIRGESDGELAAALFSAGCTIDWDMLGPKFTHITRLPPYTLANPPI